MLLEDLQVVLKVAEFRSITAAAANLDMRTATASAALKRIEHTLGMELFIRTTRQLRPMGFSTNSTISFMMFGNSHSMEQTLKLR